MGRAKLRFTTDGDYKAVEMGNGERSQGSEKSEQATLPVFARSLSSGSV